MATNDGHNRRAQMNRAFYDDAAAMISPFANHEPGDTAITFDTDPPASYQLLRLPSTDIDNWGLLGAGGGGGSLVTSVFGRTGDVVFADGDAAGDQITNTSTIAGTTVTDALNNIPSLFIPIAQKAAVNGVASLDGTGRVPTSQLPPLEVTAKVTVADTAARLALPGTDATMAFQLDTGEVWFIGAGQVKSVAGNWGLVAGSLGGVVSFNSRTGVVVPAPGDYTAAQVTNVPAGNIAGVTVQAAINELDAEKLPLSHAGTGGTAHAIVTTSVAGFMSAADKVKLDAVPGGTIPVLTSTAPLSVGTTNALGSSTEAARGDHVHAHGNRPGGAEHALVTTSVDGFMSAADKVLLDALPPAASIPVLSSTVPAAVAATGAIGVGTTAARHDHVHAHGNQGGGALHADATTAVPGFMSGTDKTKLDAYPSTPAGLPASGVTQIRLQPAQNGIRGFTDVTYTVADDTVSGGDSTVLAIDFSTLNASVNAGIGTAAATGFFTVPVMIGAAVAGPGLLTPPGKVSMGQIHGASLPTVTSAGGTDLLLKTTSANVYNRLTVDSLFTNRTITTATEVTPLIRGPRYVGVAAVTSGIAVTLSAETNGHDRTVTLTGNATITLFAAATTTNAMTLATVRLVQDATGSRTVTWAPPSGDTIAWDGSATAPAIATAANSVTIIGFIKHQGSTVWRGKRLFIQN